MNKILTTNLIKVIKSCNTEEELKELLIGLFTPQELEVVDTRLEIVKQLKRGKSQRAIAEELGVGIATVTRGAREVKQGRFEVIK
ncbi:helix-turn-helix domain-containing protein [Candidatus Roizmanbacteria bacterium]|nr:MAG: helix-turn-helix domain-containing protein [Candidatus Roizmanbacteria bacterium]